MPPFIQILPLKDIYSLQFFGDFPAYHLPQMKGWFGFRASPPESHGRPTPSCAATALWSPPLFAAREAARLRDICEKRLRLRRNCHPKRRRNPRTSPIWWIAVADFPVWHPNGPPRPPIVEVARHILGDPWRRWEHLQPKNFWKPDKSIAQPGLELISQQGRRDPRFSKFQSAKSKMGTQRIFKNRVL